LRTGMAIWSVAVDCDAELAWTVTSATLSLVPAGVPEMIPSRLTSTQSTPLTLLKEADSFPGPSTNPATFASYRSAILAFFNVTCSTGNEISSTAVSESWRRASEGIVAAEANVTRRVRILLVKCMMSSSNARYCMSRSRRFLKAWTVCETRTVSQQHFYKTYRSWLSPASISF
jgi:hypothetical protein